MRVSAAASSALLRSIQQSVASKQQSATEVTQAYLQQLKSVEGSVNAFLTVDEQAALAQVGLHSQLLRHCCRRRVCAAVDVLTACVTAWCCCCCCCCCRRQLWMLL
jgi:Asp-tRNA(Asn)/Glu-tRNA(Gln) amidotransferase A subunit family amidase